ncbi:conserved hypothetical protein [Hyella patelloides LEGE 07179]|uniref:DUF2605 domain-containing protein n=1 Tax=Hyella patelloides LEGE 07179 TaxID=945734 RepID=A0A563VST4_9CYAN|nr:DUF2605 domain-containing protein [Hyella patelloides]VEP14495.1 conserved hypothetical protein [Hyella patelloides LEGE 07179]
MSPKQPTEKELLKQVLEPLLDDFQYWFERSLNLLESEKLPFFSEEEQAEFAEKVKAAQQEVNTAKMLFRATEGEVGIESKMLLPWHNLVAQCWDVARMWRQFQEKA